LADLFHPEVKGPRCSDRRPVCWCNSSGCGCWTSSSSF